jgi:hypothetical protein
MTQVEDESMLPNQKAFKVFGRYWYFLKSNTSTRSWQLHGPTSDMAHVPSLFIGQALFRLPGDDKFVRAGILIIGRYHVMSIAAARKV